MQQRWKHVQILRKDLHFGNFHCVFCFSLQNDCHKVFPSPGNSSPCSLLLLTNALNAMTFIKTLAEEVMGKAFLKIRFCYIN